MSKDTPRQIAVIVATIATITVNILASALPLNGLDTGEISDRFDVFFVPAGYVFAIWGLIYIGWVAYSIFQALPANKENPALRRIGWLYVVASVVNISWLFLWHYEQFVPSVVAMLVLLTTLILIYTRLDIGRVPVSRAMNWFVHIPFSIYLGWITVATIANITAVLDFVQWNAFGISGEVWTIIMLTAAVLVAALMSLRHGDIAFSLVIIWAVTGIAVKHSDNTTVAVASWTAAALVALFMVVGAYRHRQGMRDLAPAN